MDLCYERLPKPKLRDLKCITYRFRLITPRLTMQTRLLLMQNQNCVTSSAMQHSAVYTLHIDYRFRLITTRLAMQIRLLSMQNCVPYVSSTRTQGGEDTEKRGGKFSNLWIQMKMKEIIKTFKF